MGQRGPQPLPTALLELRGSWKAKKREAEPSALGTPTCPDWLPDEGKALFRKLTKQLKDLNILGAIDQQALGRYCMIWLRWREAETKIRENGLVDTKFSKDYKDSKDKTSPYVAIADSAAEKLLRLEQNFGMTPSARASLGVSLQGGIDAERKNEKKQFFRNA